MYLPVVTDYLVLGSIKKFAGRLKWYSVVASLGFSVSFGRLGPLVTIENIEKSKRFDNQYSAVLMYAMGS